MSTTRTEHDSMGDLEVPTAALYAAQTQRAARIVPVCPRYARTMPTTSAISTPSRSAMSSALMSPADTEPSTGPAAPLPVGRRHG